ncbi:sigma-70 family RNA polymerase sigma factor [Kitasatospora sp. NPDC048545]|uniref:sigma-70 family RNA polymerase sigma factor n=1 Tax=Kitasatospora sp. NPDC048545 TaxID=3157208 RepID=UPI0033FDFB6F
MASRTRTRARRAADASGRPGAAADDLRALLARSASGDDAAFELLYRAVAGPVYGVALRILRSPVHAEEVAQEVLLEVWRIAAAYRPERGTVTTWVLTIAHHRAVDRVRSARAAADREQRTALPEAVGSDPPDEQVVRSLDRLRVRSALADLSGAQREAVVLAYYGGYSQREIAHLLDLPLGTVKTRIRDGLGRLRTAFASAPARPSGPAGPSAARTAAAAGPGAGRAARAAR